MSGTFSAENLNAPLNQVIAQLSNATGSFADPIELGRITTNSSGNMTVSIPQDIFSGTGYRIRLVTTNYPLISEDNGFDITIGSGETVAEHSTNHVSVFLNPADQSLRLVSDEPISVVALYNMKGELVLSFPETNNETSFSVTDIDSGMYVLRCQCDQKTISQKVMIDHGKR